MDAPARCLAIAGPTASGKSSLSLHLAQQLAARGQAVEIISVDSALVYRGMDIGTAKPSAAELAQVPHHLIDIRDPLHAYSAAEFVRDAQRLIHEITARGALPLLVGGTMLYFNAWLHGIDELPQADAALRTALNERGRREGWPALHAELATVDAATAARLSPNDSQRIQRALEVWHTTGRPMSELLTSKVIAKNPTTSRAEESFPSTGRLFLSLEPANRAWLHERIAQRFDAMLAAGFVDEVRGLRARGDLHPDLPSMRCVGYRQAWHMLDHGGSLEQLRDTGIAATRQLAKRQITWLRSMGEREVLACDDPALQTLAWQRVARWLQDR